jgi:hypothetical protein
MDVQIGDIIIVHSQTIVGKLIRWVTNSWASHIAVYIGNGLVFEARPGGAKAVPLTNYNGQYRVFRLNVDLAEISKFVENLELKQNKGYDYGQIFSIAFEDLFHIKIKAQNKRLTICSEIVYESAQEAGIPVPPVSQAYITPGDFFSWNILTEVIN